jgi:hypothetical protein
MAGIYAPNFPATKFFKSPLSFRKPQRLSIGLDFVIERRNQSLCKLNPISQGEFHRIGCELI